MSRAKAPEKPAVLSLGVLSQMDPEARPPASEFRVLVAHFLERFFNNELMSANGESKTRLVQLAFAIGLPGMVAALYLYPAYHPPRGTRPYWGQVGDHYFFVLYSLVATGLLTIFAWDFFFPDLLDALTLGTLPLGKGRVFRARVAAGTILLAAFLFDSNFMAPLVLPEATDPEHLFRFLAAHVCAVTLAGVFSFSCVLALEGLLLAMMGERWFRKVSLGLQMLLVFALATMLLLYPVFSVHLRALCASPDGSFVPPLWFLGVYQAVLQGRGVPAGLTSLARTACWATLIAALSAAALYPFAYLRKGRGLVEGAVARRKHGPAEAFRGLATSFARTPQARAVGQFIGQTLVGVPRYRVYLALYGGVGLALMASAVVRIGIGRQSIFLVLSREGLRATVPIVAFWAVSGLSTTFQSPADQRGTWIFRAIGGRASAIQLNAARHWALGWSLALSMAVVAMECALVPALHLEWRLWATQVLVAVALCVLLTDAFFLSLRAIPFTHRALDDERNLAFLLVPYLGAFPAVVLATISAEPWIEASGLHMLATALGVAAIHFALREVHRGTVRDCLGRPEDRDDQVRYPLGLGTR